MEILELNFWKGKKVLVTGATGLVGGWLVRSLLELGADITCLCIDLDPSSELVRSGDADKVTIFPGDLKNFGDVRGALGINASEFIFHLGAQTLVEEGIQNPVRTFESNIQGTWNVLEAARVSKTPILAIVVASSDKAYGTSEILPYLENFPLHGDGPYDVSKSCTDLIAQTYGKTYALPVTIARCGNIYGGGDLNWSRIVPGTIRNILNQEVTQLRSDGTFLRDYVHVSDVISAYLTLAESMTTINLSGEAFNFSRDEPLSVIELHKSIYRVLNVKYLEPIILNSAKSEIMNQHLSSKKAKKILGWESRISLTEGLESTYSWYSEFFKGAIHE